MLNPRGFRLRELERLTGISSGAIQHELAQLIDAGIIQRSEEHGQILYRANTSSQIYPEIRSIVEKTMGQAVAIREALLPFQSLIQAALIYGSTASGKADHLSDIDLLVIGALTYSELLMALQPVEKQLGREISSHLMTPEDFEEKLRAKDRFLSSILNKPVTPILGEIQK